MAVKGRMGVKGAWKGEDEAEVEAVEGGGEEEVGEGKTWWGGRGGGGWGGGG